MDHRPLKELAKGFTEARKARVAARVSELKHEMAMHELRQAHQRSHTPGLDASGRSENVRSSSAPKL